MATISGSQRKNTPLIQRVKLSLQRWWWSKHLPTGLPYDVYVTTEEQRQAFLRWLSSPVTHIIPGDLYISGLRTAAAYIYESLGLAEFKKQFPRPHHDYGLNSLIVKGNVYVGPYQIIAPELILQCDGKIFGCVDPKSEEYSHASEVRVVLEEFFGDGGNGVLPINGDTLYWRIEG